MWMVEDNILDDYKEEDANWGLVQESFEYRMLLTLLWMLWGAWSFYDGTVVLQIIIEGQGLLPLLRYHMGMVYEDYFLSILSLGMAIVVFKQSENRIFYLFSYVGIRLFLWSDLIVANGTMLVFIPMFILLFLRNFRTCLICLVLSYLLLFFLTLHASFDDINSLFTRSDLLLFYTLIFMNIFSYIRRFLPLKEVTIKLRYRLYLLIGFLPFILGCFF